MASIVIEVEERTNLGKNSSRRLRRAGRIPAVLYGAGKPNFPVSVDPRDIEQILHSEAGENTLLDLRLKGRGSQRQAMIRDYQTDPLSGKLMHCDLVRIEMDIQVEVEVPIRPVGTAPGVKEQGGLLEVVHRELEVQCLPGDIPEQIEVDVSALRIGDQVRIGDLAVGGNYRFLEAADTVLVTVVPPRLVEEPTPAVVEEEAEPEVIAKGKKEEEPEEGKEEKGESASKGKE